MRFSIALPLSSDPFALLIAALLFGLIPGAIPFGFLAGRLRGIDIRRHGSGNIGFTNVARVMGWQFAAPVLLLDLAKGFLPVFLVAGLSRALVDNPGQLLMLHGLLGPRLELLKVVAGLGAILGHLFTPALRFKGGKGVATTAGVMLALSPPTFALCVALFIVLLLTTRYLSVASMAAAIALPLAALVFARQSPWIVGFSVVIALVILVRHAGNLKRLSAGAEPRFSLRPSRSRPTP
jgi:glycerol-3-phosphate acyltransferase PlsY